ncbi:calcium-activated potassium channel subunit beta-2 [Anguilla rostrata]|uniref:calcium-activated potassium channel subunit beta-2 n=1 Tax=Anguilla rostrata TaxID=7938 RepID=UPI0030CE4136
MFLWAGSKGAQASGHERRTIYQKIRGYDILDKRRTVTAQKAGEDRAILLGLAMILCSVMMYFVLGITMLRSYSDSEWTAESSCTVLNSSITAEVNCTYSCGSDCRRPASYPCLQVFVRLNASGRVLRLSHNEEAQDKSPECFYVPRCRRDSVAMLGVMLNVSEWLKTQPRLLCFYDPGERRDAALLTRLYGRGAVFHSLVWPSCTLGGGVLIVAMVKLTQYLSILCEQIGKIKR